jgi:hypothetical protein
MELAAHCAYKLSDSSEPKPWNELDLRDKLDYYDKYGLEYLSSGLTKYDDCMAKFKFDEHASLVIDNALPRDKNFEWKLHGICQRP